jgi:hypothetical protein
MGGLSLILKDHVVKPHPVFMSLGRCLFCQHLIRLPSMIERLHVWQANLPEEVANGPA